MTDALEYNPPRPVGSMILLHGLGADGGDLLPLAKQLGGGRLRAVCPTAPLISVTLNGGLKMPAWYDIVGVNLEDRQDEAGILASAKTVEALLAAERGRGFNKIFLGGFSQGAAMALFVGVRHQYLLSGIFALSGYLPLADKTKAESVNKQTPIFMAHGILDTVVLPVWGRQSCDLLLQNGWTADYYEYAAAHLICPPEIVDLDAWLKLRLADGEKAR